MNVRLSNNSRLSGTNMSERSPLKIARKARLQSNMEVVGENAEVLDIEDV